MLSIANSASISALTITSLVFGAYTIEAQTLIVKYFLPFVNVLDVITVDCLMLFATTINTPPWARSQLVSGVLVVGKKYSGLMLTEISAL